jgi:predicted chitinase
MAGKIIGNQNPVVGIKYEYEVNTLASILMGSFGSSNTTYEWYIYKKGKNGTWKDVTQTPKKGIKVLYNFGEIGIGVEFRLKVYEVKLGLLPSKASSKTLAGILDIIPASSKTPQIDKVILLNKGSKDVNKANYRDTLIAQAHCIAMFDEEIEFQLWEDDAAGGGHNAVVNKNNRNLRTYKAKVNEKGIAETKIPLSSDERILKQVANKYLMKGEKSEGKNHEYYITASYHGKIKGASQVNVDVANPDYKKNSPKSPIPPSKQLPVPKKQEPKKTTSQKSQPKENTPKFPATKSSSAPKQTDTQGRITDAYFVNNNGQKLSKITVGDKIRVRIASSNMKDKHIQYVIWEYDAASHDEIYRSNKIKLSYDLADMPEITITKEMFENGIDVWGDPDKESQNYFIEVLPLDVSAYSKRFGVDSDGLMEVETVKSVAVVNEVKVEKKDHKPGDCPNCDKDITAEDLKTIFPDADVTKRQSVANTYNKYMKDLGMNTCWNKAHLFAQARVEAGLALNMKTGESFNYYYEGLSIFGAFQTREGKEKAKLLGRPTKLPKLPGVNRENQIKIANYAYSPPAKKAKELENTEPNDGWKYRGRGLIQVTGKGFYKYCNQYTKKGGYDVTENPDLIGEKIELAVLASMVFFKWKGINKLANGTKDVKGKICPLVGKDVLAGGKSNYDEKQKAFKETTSKVFKVDECKWGKIIENLASSNDSVLEEMKKLVDQHIPYSQSGTRNALTEEGLENLDCSETVGIYFYKLGVMPNYKAIDTSTMTTEANLRTTIGSNNIDLVSGSDKKEFKPQRGDVFVWRKGAAGPGHTGIVYHYDETKDIVTILEAIGNVGAVSESDQVNNGGYSKAGCSRTAKYSRLKGALYGHKGWAGYFRPKNYTKKL